MNFKILILGLSVSSGLIVTIVLGLAHESLVVVWLGILLTSFSKMKNHFISLLLILEMLSLGSLAVSSFFVKTAGTLNLMFVLMSLSVGEAVLGLAILVKLIRFNSSELVLTGLS